MSTLSNNHKRFGLVLAASLSAAVLGGCGLSTLTSGLGGSGSGTFGGSSGSAAAGGKVNDDELLAAARGDGNFTGSLSEISASCPRVVVPARDNNVTIYEAGRAGDALAVMHRGELTKTARECQIEGNRVTVNVAQQAIGPAPVGAAQCRR